MKKTKTTSSAWTTEDDKKQFRELAKALLEQIPFNAPMKVDNKIRKAGEQLASPSQGLLVLWVQCKNEAHWSTEIRFDRRLKEVLAELVRKGGWYLEMEMGAKVITFVFKFTGEMGTFLPVDIREGGKSLRGVGRKISALSRPVDGLRNAA